MRRFRRLKAAYRRAGVEGLLHGKRGLPLVAAVVAGAQAGARLSPRLHGRWIFAALAVAFASVGLRLLLVRPDG